MENLFIVPQSNYGIIACIENNEIIKYGAVDIPYQSKSVVSDNLLVITICLGKKELKIHTLSGMLLKTFNQVNFRCIAIKGNVVYLGGQNNDKEFGSVELFAIEDLDKFNFPLRQINIPMDLRFGKSIDDILIVDNKLILVDNVEFPKYLFEYDITEPSKPIHTSTTDLENNGTYEHIIKGDANKNWLILFSKSAGMFGKSTFITIKGKTSERLDFHMTTEYYRNRFPDDLQEDDKYNYRDICLINDNLFVLREDGLYFLDLNGTISKSNLIKIDTTMGNIDKLIKTPCSRIVAVNENNYELIK